MDLNASKKIPNTTMHELFLSASVEDEDLSRALRILQGYCAMKPVSVFRRRLFWEGPRTRNVKYLTSKRDEANRRYEDAVKRNEASWGGDEGSRREVKRFEAWKSLFEQVIRQSFVVALLYEVEMEDFGKGGRSEVGESQESDGPTYPLDFQSGTLLWADLPDPVGPRPVNTRTTVKITNEKGLCTQTASLGYRFAREVIQETHQYVHQNVVFELTRYLELPSTVTPTTNSQDSQTQTPSEPRIQRYLPPFESLTPFDGENKWILTARVDVVIGSDQEPMRMGVTELGAIKADFEGCFEFRVVDRHVLDTRVKG